MSKLREALAGIVDVIDRPTFLDMAKSCQGHSRLRTKEQDFVNHMVWLAAGGRQPSPKQAKWLRDIFDRSGTQQ
jgi:hypothetical protein